MACKIYRVENTSGEGMYRGYCPATDNMLDDIRHPTPCNDSKLGKDWQKSIEGHIFFGFASKEQLLCWIYKTEWREQIEKQGFSVSVYEVDEDLCRLGDTQAIFIRAKATKVEEIRLTEL